MPFSPIVLYAICTAAAISIAAAVYFYLLSRRQKDILELEGLFHRQWVRGIDQSFFVELPEALRTRTGADTVCVLLGADSVTAETVVAVPASPFPGPYVSPDIYAEALGQQKCLFISDYSTYPKKAFALLSLPTASAVIVPFRYTGNRSGAVLFLWKKQRRFGASFRAYFDHICELFEPHMRMYEIVTRFGVLKARYDAMLATMSQGLILIDDQSVTAWINDTAGQLLDLPPGPAEPHRIAAAMGRLANTAVNPEFIREQVLAIARNPEAVIVNLEWASAQQDGRVLRVSSRPVSSTMKGGRIWMFDDITQLKKAEAGLQLAHRELLEAMEKLEQVNRELVHVNREKDDFLGIAAHDLKNPLSGILGISQIMAEDIDLLSKDDIRDYSTLIVGRTNTMFRLITDLLNVNTLESGALPLHFESFDPDEVVCEVIRSNNTAAGAKQISIQYTNTPSLSVYADRNSLYQVLDNLISNAVKYSPKGSTVRVSLTGDNNVVRCAVKDEGPGFSKEDHQKMFGRFTRLSSLPTGGESSNGLGLYIVRKLTESMKGRVWCESVPGTGATFYVELGRYSGATSASTDASLG